MFHQDRIVEKGRELDAEVDTAMNEEQEETLHKLDDNISTAMLAAEERLQTFESSWWSEKLHTAHMIVKY
eukprot:2369360-Ditylum_brightwellii.AAC.1